MRPEPLWRMPVSAGMLRERLDKFAFSSAGQFSREGATQLVIKILEGFSDRY